jgi:sulfite reductase alpha subunit-like flavoprotein
MDYTSLIQPEPRPCPQIKENIPGEADPVDRTRAKPRLLPWPDAVEARLVSNIRLTPHDHWQDVRELTFHMHKDTRYCPGDVLTLYPQNFPEDVQSLIDLMGWNKIADSRVAFQATCPNLYAAENLIAMAHGLYPSPRTTLRQLLTDNLDITAIPKRSFFEFISHQTDDPIHKERLSEFSNPAYTDEFFDYATRPRRSILEVLQDFPSVKIPWKWATCAFPVIRGRQYSISSGGELKRSNIHPNIIQVQLLVAIVKYRTVLKKIRQGLCSRYIASLPPGTVMNVGLKNGSFEDFTKYQPNYPVILIGPGTGLAPLRSLIWERAAMRMVDETQRAKTILFYGGRNREADYFYQDEWNAWFRDVTIHTAFSRDQKEKVYVQDIIRRESQTVWEQLQKGAVVYVCGSSGNMPKAVREAIIDVMVKHGAAFPDRASAEVAVTDMTRRGHYVQETW